MRFGVGGARSGARRHGKVFLRARRGARGEVFNSASRRVRGRKARQGLHPGDVRGSSAARRGLQPGDVRSSLRRAPAGEGAEAHDLQPGEVFRLSAWAKARRPAGPQPGVMAMCSSVRVGVGEDFVACSSINFGRPGALLGSSVAFGSGCWQALPGVPRKAPLC